MNQSRIPQEEITLLLDQWSHGDRAVENKLIESLYPYIHKLAHFQLKSKSASALQTTEVVNEAFIKLNHHKALDWKNKSQFLAIAAKVIRSVIIDQYRAEHSHKRGGEHQHLTLDRIQEFIEEPDQQNVNWIELDDLITQLSAIDEDAASVVEYKIFGGLTIPEMAAVMEVSESTISRNWQFARTWILMQFK
ncbi:ECF-type sigma factor [Marinicella sediminis]|uniref:ECF-type sigma factor n=1 Tax=Marinicella sediminis TaxID=1792834 RepID=A0ABV7J6A9_9GAMM|nr:ECF-type sigma factor [Marinicella sediminis]